MEIQILLKMLRTQFNKSYDKRRKTNTISIITKEFTLMMSLGPSFKIRKQERILSLMTCVDDFKSWNKSSNWLKILQRFRFNLKNLLIQIWCINEILNSQMKNLSSKFKVISWNRRSSMRLQEIWSKLLFKQFKSMFLQNDSTKDLKQRDVKTQETHNDES